MTIDQALEQLPIVAIVRGVTPDEVIDIGEALYEQGVRAMEVPLNVAVAVSLLTQADRMPDPGA